MYIAGGSGDEFFINGKLAFSATYNEISIIDEYEVEINIPRNYPDSPPNVKEVGGRISKDYHVHHNGILCLSSPVEVKKKFFQKKSMVGFVEDLLIPYLYAHSFLQEYGEMPFGELSHGVEGIIEYYKNLFDVDSNYMVVGFLRILADNNYRGHIPCPCGSHAKLRNCHGNLLLELQRYQNKNNYLSEYFYIAKHMLEKGGREIPKDFLPKSIKKKIRNTSRKNKEKKIWINTDKIISDKGIC
ncbi:MAG: SEC-C metal-binding domain-containing protein [Syntrophales bacterium]|nr:SEC-C metal-binding domain-containing protein [Syntrophales bacterium]